MSKKRRSFGTTILERLAHFKAKPVNRDALNAVAYKPTKRKSKETPLPNPIQAKSNADAPKASLFKWADEADRRAQSRRAFGFKASHGST